ncbi:M1 family metallopeptidase [Fodinibius saliphilus]|uniref:M1 family metallopeptidase n=1 Tax=Fodinibius saliphilus TaxID=1920650 RepID=UPI001107E0D5|nr:M1 family metallopeptidase [Fodinibius saliphilus]
MKKLYNLILYGLLTCFLIALILPATAQHSGVLATKADTLRGSITPQRAWWDVEFYDLHLTVQPEDSSITGYNNITYRVTDTPKRMQIDLQDPLKIDQIKQGNQALEYQRVPNGYAYMVDVPNGLKQDSLYTISVFYQGNPQAAKNAPWDGGFVWEQDSLNNPWIATANQGLGASIWWPNKDHQTAEPDSMSINITVPNEIKNVSNGRLRDITKHENGMTTWSWFVTNPINNYNVSVNAGNYVNFKDTYQGKKGTLDLSYWVLKPNLEKAKKQFEQVKPMMRCFEKWFGPYPFYEDSFKLVHTPHLGMEHQSAIAYGNGFQNGYNGTDLSGSGWGLKWDFIIIHEAGHEWWGNNVTTKDIADMWVHESFTSYSESIYTECQFGKKAAAEYTRGLRSRIQNKAPITGKYGINNEGSGDMYYKGHNMLHTIRQIVNNDTTWRHILRGIQKKFRHQTVRADQIERYIIEQSGKNLDDIFDQYLHYADIPTLKYHIKNGILYYRWEADVAHFDMPVEISINDSNSYTFIYPTSSRWKKTKLDFKKNDSFSVNNNYYVKKDSVATTPLPGR